MPEHRPRFGPLHKSNPPYRAHTIAHGPETLPRHSSLVREITVNPSRALALHDPDCANHAGLGRNAQAQMGIIGHALNFQKPPFCRHNSRKIAAIWLTAFPAITRRRYFGRITAYTRIPAERGADCTIRARSGSPSCTTGPLGKESPPSLQRTDTPRIARSSSGPMARGRRLSDEIKLVLRYF